MVSRKSLATYRHEEQKVLKLRTLVYIPDNKIANSFFSGVNEIERSFKEREFLILHGDELEPSMQAENLGLPLAKFCSSWSSEDANTFFDALYLAAVRKGSNPTLRYLLRERLLGTSSLTFTNSFFAIKRACFRLWKIRGILVSRKLIQPETLLKLLRDSRLVNSSDVDNFDSILRTENIERVLIFTTLKNPPIYDLTESCKRNKIPFELFVDSWDNIGTCPAVPSNAKRIHLWSIQQFNELKAYFPSMTDIAEISGSLRISRYSKIPKKNYILDDNWEFPNVIQKKFRILFIQSFFDDCSEIALKSLDKALVSLLCLDRKYSIEVVIRPYPHLRKMYKISERRNTLESAINLLNIGKESIHYQISNTKTLYEELINTDLVISEISSAGLESHFAGKNVIFVYGSNNNSYFNGEKVLKFRFANDLKNFFPVVKSSDEKHLEEKVLETLKSNMQQDSKLFPYFGVEFNADCLN